MIYESGENYLETILILWMETGAVRSIDIANRLNYSKPSVSRAVSILKKSGHITVDGGGIITLTDTGRDIARMLYERHKLLSEFLMSIGVSVETAIADACRIEHVISEESFARLKEHAEKYVL